MLLDLASIRDPNRAGQAYALTFLCPIMPGHEDLLRDELEHLGADGPGPLARLPRTHFGRWVICPDFVTDPAQPHPDSLGCEYLIFTCCIDGDPDSYLDALCTELAPETRRIWRHCINAPDPAEGPALKAYLQHNQIRTGLFYSAYPTTTVPDVRRVLGQRSALRRLAVDAPDLSPAELQQRFLAEVR
ncbi:hypothetical protein LRS13_10545 [Svornostia abyssi]|uniref:Uncharacterized protein n=1 Tax=Svornostia abyssi TaxID=2898438 RepID=A0ABY5PMJ4_9ACTN|nr:hypothetical protein LRS13_10545 [Parviterribacteraceae bacterium J379]